MPGLRICCVALSMLLGCALFARQQPGCGIIDPNFATLKVSNEANPQAPPVIMAGSDDVLTISFDELATSARNLRWTLRHCDASWQPDDLLDLEFTDGLNEAEIDDVSYSRATLTHYVHYELKVPHERIPLKVSGNYLLTVYEEFEPEKPLLSVRFAVAEGSVKINARVSPKTDIDYLQAHQQLSIDVDTRGSAIRNPYTDIITVVEQHPGDFNRAELRTPSSVNGTMVRYSHMRPLIFGGGNEYRRFETVSTSYPGIRIERISRTPEGYYSLVAKDYPRSDAAYQYDSTQQGRFTIREYNSDQSDTEAEYVNTLFTFESPKLPGVDIHIEGELTGKQFSDASKMTYNPETGCYEKDLFLKQGAYDYRYVAVPAGGKAPSVAFTEGNFCDTANTYIIYVYYRLPGERFDRLAGVSSASLFNSLK